MEVKAKLSNLRIAPRKVRLVVDMIRNKNAETALNILRFTTKKSVQPILKLLNQAIANAKNNFQVEKENLFIKKITVDEGAKYKRFRPRARGQAYEIQKKTSHINLVLDVLSPVEKKTAQTETKKEEKIIETVPASKAQEEKISVKPKPEKPKMKPAQQVKKPSAEKGIRKIFRRKAI